MRIRNYIGCITVWAAILAGVALVLILLCLTNKKTALLVHSFSWGRVQFDSEDWKRFSGAEGKEGLTIEQRDTRGKMMFSLLINHWLTGKSRTEVASLLGEPDYGANGYWIGNHSGLGIDPDILFVSYDKDGRVSGFWSEQH